MQSDYSLRLLKEKTDYAKLQQAWRDKLGKFVEAYPKCDDTADALLQLGMTCEFLGKEADAKKWYGKLGQEYGDKAAAVKARGAVRRLELDGKELQLHGPTLAGGSFELAGLKGKAVVVYYWASWNQQVANDLFKLKTLSSAHGIEIVTVNLDNSPAEAKAFLDKNPSAGTHLFQQPSGLDGTLANQYGINVLPSLFLIGRDGKVVSHTVQISSLEDEIKKLIDGK